MVRVWLASSALLAQDLLLLLSTGHSHKQGKKRRIHLHFFLCSQKCYQRLKIMKTCSLFQKHTMNMILNFTMYGFSQCCRASPTRRGRVTVFKSTPISFQGLKTLQIWVKTEVCLRGSESTDWFQYDLHLGPAIWTSRKFPEKIVMINLLPLQTESWHLPSHSVLSSIRNYNGIFILRVCDIQVFNN